MSIENQSSTVPKKPEEVAPGITREQWMTARGSAAALARILEKIPGHESAAGVLHRIAKAELPVQIPADPDPPGSQGFGSLLRRIARSSGPLPTDREAVVLAHESVTEILADLSSLAGEMEPDLDLSATLARLGSAASHLASLSERWVAAEPTPKHQGEPDGPR